VIHLKRAVIVGAVIALTLAWADAPGAPPPEVQAILNKMHSGKPPTATEQATLKAWQSNRLGQAEGYGPDAGLTPPDVQAIMAKLRQGGVPTPAEVEALKAYGAQAGAHKGELLDREAQLKGQLEAARPTGPTARGTPSDSFFHGTLSVKSVVKIDSQGRDGSSHTTTTFDVKLPVAYWLQGDLRAGGNFKLTLFADGHGAPSGSLTTDFQGNSSCETTSGHGGAPVGGWHSYYRINPTIANANPVVAVINRPAGAPRAYLMTLTPGVDGKGSTHGTTQHTCQPTSTSSGDAQLDVNQANQFTLDNVMPGVEGSSLSTANLAALRQYGVPADPTAQSPELTAAFRSVQFTFPADAFINDFATGHFNSTGVYSYTMRTTDTGSGSGTITSTTTLRFEVSNGPTIKAFIVPDSLDDYTKWVPEGPKYPQVSGKGNTLPVHIALENTATHTGVTQKITTHFVLRNVSKLPGWSTNYPIKSAADDEYLKPDLRFDAATNPTDATLSGDKLELDTAKDKGDQTVTVTSYDYGAYGSLQATVTLEDGSKVDAELKPEVSRISGKVIALALPPDRNDNHVADWWEDHHGASDQRSSWDEDAQPHGQADVGDGLTLFEEYRGFVVADGAAPELLRLDPAKKDAFMYDPDGIFKQYYLPFNPAKVTWHLLKIGMFVYNGLGTDPDDRWLNSNTPDQPDLRYARQYTMVTRSGCVPDSYNPIDPADKGAAGRSMNAQEAGWDRGSQAVVPDRTDGQACHASWFAEACIARMGPYIRRKGQAAHATTAQIEKSVFAQNAVLVMHEVGHLLSISHHAPDNTGGSQQCSMVYGPTDPWLPAWQTALSNYCGAEGGPDGPDNCFGKITVKCRPAP
jgi:hypothetical protein